MPRYTFFFEYDGGTYISQIEAINHVEALKAWARGFNLDKEEEYAPFFEADFQKKLRDSTEFEEPVEIRDLSKTWCGSTMYLDRPATISFTQTVDD